MTFATVSPKEEAQYSYICARLKSAVTKMHAARQTLEATANASFDKFFAKSVYVLISESLQCENEIRSHIDSLNCNHFNDNYAEDKNILPQKKLNGLDGVCNYCEAIYMTGYSKLLKDRRIGTSLKNLIKNHVRMFASSLAQLQMLNDVRTMVN